MAVRNPRNCSRTSFRRPLVEQLPADREAIMATRMRLLGCKRWLVSLEPAKEGIEHGSMLVIECPAVVAHRVSSSGRRKSMGSQTIPLDKCGKYGALLSRL